MVEGAEIVMPGIPEYVHLIKRLLAEVGCYFLLLVFVVLATRLWRRAVKVPREKSTGNFLLAALVSVVACGIGYFSICHSMSLMYSYFGMKAFHAYKLDSALVLFQDSLGYRKNADALGGKGVCLLWLGDSRKGIQLLNDARAMRGGKGSTFEDFYEGLYYFYDDDPTNAIPLLEAASADPAFQWDVTKLFASLQLDWNRPQEATRLMQPYLQAEVTDADQAYIMASLKLAERKTNEAEALMDEFLTNNPPPYWKIRLEKLRARTQGRAP